MYEMITKIRIKSDGTGRSTEVYSVEEDGSEHLIPNVTKVLFEVESDSFTTATIEFTNVEVDLIAGTGDLLSV